MKMGKKMMSDLAGSIPGADEMVSYAEIMKLVQMMQFEVVVFDTAPTGHTLKLLKLPGLVEKSFGKLLGMKNMITPLINQVGCNNSIFMNN